MRNTKRILITLLVAFTMILALATITSGAEEGNMVYLTPNSNWRADNARFAVYTWDGGNRWFDMTDSNGDGVYECLLPPEVSNLIFVRLSPDSTDNSWDNKWNQTDDLVLPTNGDNHYKVASGTWDKGGGTWSYFDSDTCVHSPSGSGNISKAPDCTEKGEISYTCSKCGQNYTESLDPNGHNYNELSECQVCGHEAVYIIAGNVMKAGDYYAEGDNSTLFGSEWDVSDENNKLTYDPDAGLFVKIYKNVAAGEYHFKVAQDMSWDISYGLDGGNCYLYVPEDGCTVTITFMDGEVSCAAAMPTDPDKTDKDEDGVKPGSPDNSDDKSDDATSEPEVKLNFFQKIWRAILNFFRNLFGKNKK